MAEHPSFTMAGLCSVGGLIGYARTGSIPSAVAGVAFGAAYAYTGYRIKQNQDLGIELATGTSIALAASQLPRAIKLAKPMPIALSATALLATAYYSKKWYEQENGV